MPTIAKLPISAFELPANFSHTIFGPSHHPVNLSGCHGCVYHIEEYHVIRQIDQKVVRNELFHSILTCWCVSFQDMIRMNVLPYTHNSTPRSCTPSSDFLCGFFLHLCSRPNAPHMSIDMYNEVSCHSNCTGRRSRKHGETPVEKTDDKRGAKITCYECKRHESASCPIRIKFNVHTSDDSSICDSFLRDIKFVRHQVDRVLDPDPLLDSIYLLIP